MQHHAVLPCACAPETQGICRIMLCCHVPVPLRRAIAARLELWTVKLYEGMVRYA